VRRAEKGEQKEEVGPPASSLGFFKSPKLSPSLFRERGLPEVFDALLTLNGAISLNQKNPSFDL
jgi:hypothetical protein